MGVTNLFVQLRDIRVSYAFALIEDDGVVNIGAAHLYECFGQGASWEWVDNKVIEAKRIF